MAETPVPAAIAHELRRFQFHDDELEVVFLDGEVWVSLRRLCKAFRLSFSVQLRKLKRLAWARVGTRGQNDHTRPAGAPAADHLP